MVLLGGAGEREPCLQPIYLPFDLVFGVNVDNSLEG